MKIAINAIRVSHKGGGGVDSYIIGVVNELAALCKSKKYSLTVYTLAPHFFTAVHPQDIIQPSSLACLSRLGRSSQPKKNSDEQHQPQSLRVAGLPQKNRSFSAFLKSYFADYLKMFWTQIIFPLELWQKRYDLVFSPTQYDALPFSPTAQVLMVLDVQFFLFPQFQYKHTFFLKHILPVALKTSSKILTLTHKGKKHMQQVFPFLKEDKIIATHIAPKVSNFQTTAADFSALRSHYSIDRYVLCVSTGDIHKNLHMLLDAFCLVKDKVKEDLVIVGYRDPKQTEFLNTIMEEKQVADRVHFVGHVTDRELEMFYKNASCFIYPTMFTGFGLPPLEAMRWGVPVAVANSDYIPEVVENAGIYFDPRNPQSIADAIEKILSDEVLKKELIAKGSQRFQQFSWVKCAQETLAVFESAGRRGRG